MLIGFLGKEGGGERPIGLTAMLYRFAMRLYKGIIGSWDEKFHAHWDYAVKNSSCLRAALLRALKLEVGALSNLCTASILWDIRAFFDSIRICDVVKLGVEHQFPPMLLRLALLVHVGPRAFKEKNFIGPWLQSTGLSIVAGCVSSVSITRCILYNVVSSMHINYRPIQINTFVDDCPQIHTGTNKNMSSHVPVAASAFATEMRSLGFAVSNKTTVVSSSQELATHIQNELGKVGIFIKCASVGRDVGCDLAGGSRRRVSLQKFRLAKAKTGAKIISQLSKKTKDFKKLVFTGIRSRLYGFSVMGSAPSTTRMARNAVRGPLGLRKPGGCTTTGFALGCLSKKDPAITIPIENVTDFISGHLASDHQMVTAKLWPDVASKLQAPGRWSRVFGPLSSAIATLLDFDWAVPSITQWVSPDGASWVVDFSAPNLIQMVKELLMHYFQASLWKKADIFHQDWPQTSLMFFSLEEMV